VARYIMGVAPQSPRRQLVLGCASGWRNIWGGNFNSPSVNGIVVDDRGSDGYGTPDDPAVTTGDGLWKIIVNDE
jgi:hypothetical protein